MGASQDSHFVPQPRPNDEGSGQKGVLRGALRLRYPNGSPGCTGSGGFLEGRARAGLRGRGEWRVVIPLSNDYFRFRLGAGRSVRIILPAV